jgi:hypothetical protein
VVGELDRLDLKVENVVSAPQQPVPSSSRY